MNKLILFIILFLLQITSIRGDNSDSSDSKGEWEGWGDQVTIPILLLFIIIAPLLVIIIILFECFNRKLKIIKSYKENTPIDNIPQHRRRLFKNNDNGYNTNCNNYTPVATDNQPHIPV